MTFNMSEYKTIGQILLDVMEERQIFTEEMRKASKEEILDVDGVIYDDPGIIKEPTKAMSMSIDDAAFLVNKYRVMAAEGKYKTLDSVELLPGEGTPKDYNVLVRSNEHDKSEYLWKDGDKVVITGVPIQATANENNASIYLLLEGRVRVNKNLTGFALDCLVTSAKNELLRMAVLHSPVWSERQTDDEISLYGSVHKSDQGIEFRIDAVEYGGNLRIG